MTCIVGLVENGIVYMGGDSAACDDSSLQIIRGSKVFKKDGFLFGISGNPRMSDILKYNFEIPPIDEDQDILEYMYRYFVPDLEKCLLENGVLIKQNEIISSDAWVLIGYQGKLFILESHFHLSESSLNYNAIGSGMDAALGCLYGLMESECIHIDPKIKLNLALRASERFNCNVRRPFTILSTAQQD